MRLDQSSYRDDDIAGVFTGVGPRLLLVCCALSCFCLMPSLAQAAMEVFDPSVTAAPTGYSDAEAQVPQFDPSLGTLNSISVTAYGTGNFTQLFENLGPSAGHLMIGQSLYMILDMPDQTTPILSLEQTENHSYSFSSFDGTLNYGGTSGRTAIYPVTASGQGTITSPSGLAQFTGTGFADLYLNAEGEIDLPSGLAGGNLILGGLLSAGAQFTVQYDYSTVPEASTWLGAAAALLALVLGLRRSVRKRAY